MALLQDQPFAQRQPTQTQPTCLRPAPARALPALLPNPRLLWDLQTRGLAGEGGGTRGFPTPWCHGTCQPPHPKAAPPGQPRGTLLAKTSTAVRSGRLQAERTPVIPANPSQGWGWEVKQVRLNISQLPARSRLSLRRAAVNYSRQAPSSAQPCAHPQRLAGWLIKGEPPAPAPAVLGSFQPAPLAGDESSSWDRSHPIPAPRAGGRGCCVPLRSSPRSPRASGTAPRGRAAAPSAAPLGPPGWVRLRTAGRLSPGPSRI